MELFHCFFSPVSRSSLQLNSPLFYCNYFTGRVCDPSERRQPTAPAEGGEGEGEEWGQLAQLLRPFRADPTLLPTWRIYIIVTLRLKYTYFTILIKGTVVEAPIR